MISPRQRNRQIFLFLSAVAAVCLTAFLSRDYFFHPCVCFPSKHTSICLRVELARTPAEHARGLMFRKTLPEGAGMLFIFSQDDTWAFWMKNTYIPLDIIWLDHARRVVGMTTAPPAPDMENPPVFVPPQPARYALEVHAGFAAKHHIHLADPARFEWIFDAKRI